MLINWKKEERNQVVNKQGHVHVLHTIKFTQWTLCVCNVYINNTQTALTTVGTIEWSEQNLGVELEFRFRMVYSYRTFSFYRTKKSEGNGSLRTGSRSSRTHHSVYTVYALHILFD